MPLNCIQSLYLQSAPRQTREATLLYLRRFVPSPGFGPCPYSTARLEAIQPRLQCITLPTIYIKRTFLKHFRA
jgi:hypothetical protein